MELVLGATLPGEPLYHAFGFREIERFTLTMQDGVSVEAVAMERPMSLSPSATPNRALPRWIPLEVLAAVPTRAAVRG
jgi:hypothetical protein